MSDRVQCPICQDYFRIPTEPTHDFVTFPCRHGTCRTCLQGVYSRSKNFTEADCPVCRQTFNRKAAHHLYLSFERSVVVSTITTAEKLGEMDANSKLLSVKIAGERVRKASDSLECKDSEVATTLIKAVEDFKQRIVPLFEIQEAQMEELARLRAQLQAANREATKAKAIANQCTQKDAEIGFLHRQLRDARQTHSEAFAESRSLSTEVKRLRVENERLVEAESKLEQSNTSLKGSLVEHKKTNRSQKVKIKALKEENRKLEAQIQGRNICVAEESLMIDDNRTGSEMLPRTRTPPALRTPSPPASLDLAPRSPCNSPHKDKENTQCRSLSGYEGLPPPGFKSDWSMGDARAGTNPLKRKNSSSLTTAVGISVDRTGQPIGSVQLGPKRSRRAV
ncbi:hypothetical protein E1B28_007743 [Marasmius oreades]|uniref:RING-type domain-containing protein n=1 Tax=Marasmius oreades TaxID=181124 RepID=A0A9P7S3N7_9AGAR|nr:uncharacterized protein E1B28_007743 [Marasmius oreades]KAG7094131.1 hypothetical protein E1B28_007743 [Marasmius oreades]